MGLVHSPAAVPLSPPSSSAVCAGPPHGPVHPSPPSPSRGQEQDQPGFPDLRERTLDEPSRATPPDAHSFEFGPSLLTPRLQDLEAVVPTVGGSEVVLSCWEGLCLWEVWPSTLGGSWAHPKASSARPGCADSTSHKIQAASPAPHQSMNMCVYVCMHVCAVCILESKGEKDQERPAP